MLTIGAENYYAIGGPISFTVLSPTETINDIIGSKQPIIILMGDSHESDEGLCSTDEMCVTFPNRCLSITSKEWYLLLDSISSHTCPLDYTTEVFFPLDLLNKDPTYVIQPNKDGKLLPYNRFDTEYTDTPLRWILDNHFHCFSRLQSYESDNDICFTKHIRYQFVDVRVSGKGVILDKKDKAYNFKNSFESNLLSSFSSTLNHFTPTTKIHPESKLSVEYVALLPLVNITLFATTLWDDPSFQKHSLVFKQIKKETNKEFFRDTFIEYFNFTLADDFKSNIFDQTRSYVKFKEQVKKEFIEASMYDMWCAKDFIARLTPYQDIVAMYIRKIFTPFLDLYFLFRMWKKKQNLTIGTHYDPWCYVLNAGNIHTSNLFAYLTTKGYFTAMCDVGLDTFKHVTENSISCKQT
jgi:hypothetical protein